MSAIRVGDRVVTTSRGGAYKAGIEFTVTEIGKGGYLKGDPKGFGIWPQYVDFVKPGGFASGGYVSPEGAKATMNSIAAGGCVIPGYSASLPKIMFPTDPPKVGTPYPEVDIRPFDERVAAVLNNVSELLISKNASYGDSALNPLQVFAKSNRIEQLHVRIDDKISRIKRGTDYGEDTITDLIGYLVLLKVAKGDA